MCVVGKMAGGTVGDSVAVREWASASRPQLLLGRWDILAVAWAIWPGRERGSKK